MSARRFGVYFAWSRNSEVNADLGVLENRYPTLFEFRRALFPRAETLKSQNQFDQSIAGFLDHVILSDFEHFSQVIQHETGRAPEIIQRSGSQPPTRQFDRDFLGRFDTLIVVSLDHFRTQQAASPEEIEAIREFVQHPQKCVVVCPHHDIGVANTSDDERLIEFRHHQDGLIPASQRIGGFARSLFEGLNIGVENRHGLHPASVNGAPAPLEIFDDLDDAGVLRGVTTFNLHPHLPHFHVSSFESDVKVLARQSIDPTASHHPFTSAGHRQFNAFLHIDKPSIGGRLYVSDATLWSSAFRGVESLEVLWRNLAHLR